MPNPTNNKLVDSKTIAALFDMTPRRVQQLTKDGVIAAVKEGNANRYDLLPTIQRYIRYLTAKANGREPSKKDSEIEGRRLEAEADLKRSKADIAALQLSELEGTMHRSEDVEAVMTDLVYNIRSMLVALPGRLAVDEAMMQEITAIKAAVDPGETLFVVDAMTGQDAVNTAKEFNDRLDFDGVVLTKLDGDTRGGAAISIRSVVSKPLKFISSGEKMDALQVFHPERMADRILGMGDVVSLVERAQEQFDEEEARRLKKKLVKNQFNFNDFIGQIQQIKKMGNLKDLAGMLPGVGKMLKNVDIPDDVFKQTEAIISSMTPAEREHPEIINAHRRERIAKGSGTTMADVNRLMKQFEDTRKMMKAVAGGNMKMPNMPGRRR